MPQESIVVIEDEKHIGELLKYNLAKEGYSVTHYLDGQDGLDAVMKERPQLVLLDLMLPGIDGLEICRALKQNYKTADIPIIMLTAKTQESDVVLGLEMGADDYVTKPFSVRPLIARIRAVLRRRADQKTDRILEIGDLTLDTAKHLATLGRKEVEMTAKEFSILRLLMESHGRVLSRETILEQVWGHDESIHIEARAVDKHVAELRKKLKHESSRLVTIKNFGYRFHH